MNVLYIKVTPLWYCIRAISIFKLCSTVHFFPLSAEICILWLRNNDNYILISTLYDVHVDACLFKKPLTIIICASQIVATGLRYLNFHSNSSGRLHFCIPWSFDSYFSRSEDTRAHHLLFPQTKMHSFLSHCFNW